MALGHGSGKGKGGRGRRWLCVFLTLLTLFLLGTVVVLSTVVAYFGVDQLDVITEREMDRYERLAAQAARAHPPSKPQSPLPLPPLSDDSTPLDDGLDRRAITQDEDDDDTDDDWTAAQQQDSPADQDEDRSTTSATPRPSEEPQQRIPKIVHQTWMVDTLPDRWEKVRQGCQALHPDYEYLLWTDASSREFIAQQYPWFLSAFDGYPYPIQRADAIRYFVLHHYGGIYMDLDVGCQQRMDPLLYFPVILPATIPVGVSNDIMLSEKGHPFMDLVIHNLVTFNHQYGTNYPTVMFSTGPMFLSAQYGLWPKEDPDSRIEDRQVRILPRRWYGKNAPEGERELAYFSHFYGSSWHADDAGFITFLGKFGLALMYMGFGVVFFGAGRLLWSKRFALLKAPSSRTSGPIALPFHVPDPYGRPGTPGSRPGSPSRSGTPHQHHAPHPQQPGGQGQQGGRAGVLYYLPVWFMPPPGTPSSNSGNGQGGWTSYLPGFDDPEANATGQGYHPIPGYSRPPSPTGNSIYNAAGAIHDGAFDGTAMHSFPAPASPRSSNNNNNDLEHAHAPSTPSAPNSPTTLSTTLKGWGAFFRPSQAAPGSGNESNGGPPLAQPTPRVPHEGAPRYTPRTIEQSTHARVGSNPHSTSNNSSRVRARSPLPPAYAADAKTASRFPETSPRSPVSAVPHSPRSPPFVSVGAGTPAGSGGETQTQDDVINGSEDGEWEGEGRVEDEVDRLLRSLEPDVKAREE